MYRIYINKDNTIKCIALSANNTTNDFINVDKNNKGLQSFDMIDELFTSFKGYQNDELIPDYINKTLIINKDLVIKNKNKLNNKKIKIKIEQEELKQLRPLRELYLNLENLIAKQKLEEIENNILELRKNIL